MKKTAQQLVAEAEAEIETISVEEAFKLHGDPDVVIVDVRDVRELKREGFIPGAFHAPRGMMEFWIDPDSPYFKPIFGEDKRFLLHCAVDWRSALTVHTLKQMGMDNVAHIRGGFNAWRDAGCPVTTLDEEKKA